MTDIKQTKNEECFRCGHSISDKPYGSCYTGYTSFKRHLWKDDKSRIRITYKETKIFTKEDVDEAYTQGKEDEQKRVEKVLDSFIVEDEFYGKGLIEIQTELIIKAIKIQLNQLSKEQGNK